MSRNEELHFSSNPTSLDIPRSKFRIPFDNKTTLNEGELVPLGVFEYLPGDTASIKLSSLVRMATPIYPVMDNAYMDIYFFSVPNRLVWDHWKAFMGENETSYWTPDVEYQIPQVTAPTGGWQKGTIADHMGLPIGVEGISVDAMKFRAMALVYNEWFRSENLIEPLDINKGDATIAGSNGTDATVDVQKGGMPPKVGRLADYFSSCLPSPQKGPDVFIPLGNTAPVMTTTEINGKASTEPLMWAYQGTDNLFLGADRALGVSSTGHNAVANNGVQFPGGTNVVPANLWTDLSQAGAATINQLRQAFAVQRMYEKDARGGTRYTELLRSHFGVVSPDARQQRPEYLGGKRININMSQVLQTSATDDVSPQGNTAAYSLTLDTSDMFTKSFTEHGHIIALGCIRIERTYSQGIERMWSRKNREDFYFPALANIGEKVVYNREIYAQGTAEDDEVFGYNEAWAEYRYKPSIITGELRPTYAQSLDAWHYGDKYETLPILGADWFNEGRENIDRTLAVNTQDQFIADFYFETTWVRPMPIYSIPGLIDHH